MHCGSKTSPCLDAVQILQTDIQSSPSSLSCLLSEGSTLSEVFDSPQRRAVPRSWCAHSFPMCPTIFSTFVKATSILSTYREWPYEGLWPVMNPRPHQELRVYVPHTRGWNTGGRNGDLRNPSEAMKTHPLTECCGTSNPGSVFDRSWWKGPFGARSSFPSHDIH